MMALAGAAAVWSGMILMLVGMIFFIIVAFRTSLLWGLAVLFLPVMWLVFLVVEWREAKRPFFWQLWGIALVMLGVFAMAARIPFVHHG